MIGKGKIYVFLLVVVSGLVMGLPLRVAAQDESEAPAKADSVRIYLSIAYEYQKNQMYPDALHYYNEVIRLDAQNSVVYYRIAEIQLDSKDWEAAKEALEKGIAANPDYGKAYYGYFRLGSGYHVAGNIAQAVPAYEKAAELNPDYPPPHKALADLYYYQNKFDKALREYERYAVFNYDDARTFARLGQLYNQKELAFEAISAYQRSLQLKSKNVEVLSALATLYKDQQLEAKAAGINRQIIAIEPDNYDANFKLATYAKENKQYHTAIEGYKKCKQIRVGEADLHANLAEIYLELNQLTNARRELQAGIKKAPNMGWLRVLNGDLYEKQGRIDAAVEEYKKAQHDPVWGQYAINKWYTLKPPKTDEQKKMEEFFGNKKKKPN